jgi:hypothetical protein
MINILGWRSSHEAECPTWKEFELHQSSGNGSVYQERLLASVSTPLNLVVMVFAFSTDQNKLRRFVALFMDSISVSSQSP